MGKCLYQFIFFDMGNYVNFGHTNFGEDRIIEHLALYLIPQLWNIEICLCSEMLIIMHGFCY